MSTQITQQQKDDEAYNELCYLAFIESVSGRKWMEETLNRIRDEDAVNPGIPVPGRPFDPLPEAVPGILMFKNGVRFAIHEPKKRALRHQEKMKGEVRKEVDNA